MKSVLVIDTPDNCDTCDLSRLYSLSGKLVKDPFCFALNKYVEDGQIILEDCPLKKLPQIRPCNYYDFEHYTSGYDKGWNDCIEHIMPKKKEEKKNNADGDGRL